MVYCLTRDDGTELRMPGTLWESVLELAYLYGWKPAGTAMPRTEAWRRAATTLNAWNGRDYFSHQSQHVEPHDARALAGAVLRALIHVPTSDVVCARASSHSLPSRASAVAEGMSLPTRKAMRGFAAFADRGGFTIGTAV